MSRPLSRSQSGDRGAATVQMVLILPILVMMLLAAVQFALAWHADHLAQSAASRALAAARAQHGSAAAGRAAGRATLDAIAGRVLTAPTLTVQRSVAGAEVTVGGRVINVLPWLRITVQGHAAGPLDEWSPAQGVGS